MSLIDPAGGTNVFMPSAGDTFEILTAVGGLGGTTFATELLPTLGGGLFFGVLYNPNDVTLVVAGILGDYNRNGVVDAADYTVWRDTLGSTTDLRANGDNTGASSGSIDQADYAFWRTHFGETVTGTGAGAVASANFDAAVPEPVTLWLATLGAAGILGSFSRNNPANRSTNHGR